MENIFSNNPVFAIGTIIGLFGILAGHRLLIYREEKKRFDDSASEFRKVFNKAFVDVHDANIIYTTFTGDDERIKSQRVMYLNFRPHLRGVCRTQFDEAWRQYYDNYRYQWSFDDSTRDELTKDIEHLLEFTEYGLLQSMSFVCREFWWKFRFQFFGPDKETKEHIEKISEHDKPL